MNNKLFYIAIEGVIGAGKTSLAKMLGKSFNAKSILEESEENPFLSRFYKDPENFAFQTQIFYLLSRYQQLVNISQADLFYDYLIADYTFDKDRIFAMINLSEQEFLMYDKISSLFKANIIVPDLVVYLQARTERILENIQKRGIPYEQAISEDYIKALNETYNNYFFHYNKSPLLVINVSDIDFINNKNEYQNLITQITRPFTGIRYYNPIG